MATIFNRLRDEFYRGVEWRRRHVGDTPFMFILACVTGLFTGTTAFLLKRSIATVSGWLTERFSDYGPDYTFLFIPLAGILLSGIFMRYVIHRNIAHGVRKMILGFRQRVYRLSGKLIYSPFIASTFTLGFGGSAGSEGPIATTGAAIGSNIGKACRLSPHLLIIMTGCGAGAGIAGIFKAPVGGMLFTLEVLQLPLSTVAVIALLVACLTSALTAYILSGCTIDLAFSAPMPTFDTALLPWALLLGVFCGCYSLYYSYIMKKVENFLNRLGNPWVKNLVAGGILSLLVFLFPALYGEGYGIVGKIINGHGSDIANGTFLTSALPDAWVLIVIAAGILLAKCFATSSTNSGGGVAGDFAPTLFAGSVAGFFFATLLNTLFGLQLPVGILALLGMAGVMAGAIRAPMMAIFLTTEMTASYSFLLPVVVTATVAFGIVRLSRLETIYSDRKKLRDQKM